ncbi:MAG: phosphoesterase RecJ-like protein [Salibacteraceae bacterium]
MSEIEKLKSVLSTQQKIVLIPHINPDGDALGSCLGLALYLESKGHKSQVIAPNSYPKFYNWMPGSKSIILYSANPDQVKEALIDVDVIFFLDYNDFNRIGTLADIVANHPAKFVMIDHHRQPSDFVDIMFSDHDKSSTSEMVFDIIEGLGDKDLITKEIGECLYTGILTDTGSFRFGSTKKETHYAAAHLLESGVEPDSVYSKVYDTNTLNRLHLMGYILVDKLKQVKDLAAAYISISEEEKARFNFQKGDAEGFVNYGLAINGMKAAGFFMENEGYIKVSLRSKGHFDVNAIAREHFNGGGHKNAAGGRLNMTLEQAIAYFEKIMRQYHEDLQLD